jgi:hypothetical protein
MDLRAGQRRLVGRPCRRKEPCSRTALDRADTLVLLLGAAEKRVAAVAIQNAIVNVEAAR